LNGDTTRGQADGFYLEALSKTTTLRDMNNKTIMNFICEKIKQEDDEFVNFKNELKNVYVVAQHNLKDEDTKIKELRGGFDKAKNNFDIVLKSTDNPDQDVYCEKVSEFLKEAFKVIDDFERKLAGIQK
jgi:molecular chaperone GrpE (heat shock protein)